MGFTATPNGLLYVFGGAGSVSGNVQMRATGENGIIAVETVVWQMRLEVAEAGAGAANYYL